jgi:hypothetical protein
MSTSNWQVGVEVEYPESQETTTTMSQRATGSYDLHDELEMDHGARFPAGGDITYDGTVGTEINSPVIGVDEAADWYEDALYELEKYRPHEPTGLCSGRASTAGLHIHFSYANHEKAERLAELSRQPFMQVFACTSVANDNHSVFRGGSYCNIAEFDEGRYSVVHEVRHDAGHYEWRLPEPMTAENFRLLMSFLEIFSNDMDEGEEFAREIVNGSPEQLTSVQRAEALGLKKPTAAKENDTETNVEWSVERSRSMDSEVASAFWSEVQDEHSAPYIYRLENPSGSDIYAFHSNHYSTEESFVVHDPDFGEIEYTTESVLWAKDLERVGNLNLREAARTEVEEHVESRSNSSTARKSEATDLLTAILPQ